ncbi:MAG: NADP-dependent malic enzyme [Candidatus Competibacterales bacterium]
MNDEFEAQALHYHRYPTPGKLQVNPSKPLANQRDLALAYSPGVAAACQAIVANPQVAADYTARSNLVAVISNGTAVLGLGDIGPLASKPVMEGKGVLFKKFANIDVFDIEVAETDPERFVAIVKSLEPTFGGINLEDIKAPECFAIERQLRSLMNIPVFHDDQHGTAIIAAAAIKNALKLVEKPLETVGLVASGAGAAGIACLDILVGLGLPKEQIIVCDSRGVIYQGRNVGMDPQKAQYAAATPHRTLAEAIEGADIFLGVSKPGLLTAEMVASMAAKPIILALANPIPEIMPEAVKAVRDDAIIATGRSDYPNQVNNVLCFPYMFRGALDVGATTINEAMKLAMVDALAELATRPVDEDVAAAYGAKRLQFGPDYLIPKPFDNRLMVELPQAVARAAMASKVATRPIEDFAAYRARLGDYVDRTNLAMRPIFDQAKADPKRVVYAEGEEERVLRAVQVVLEEQTAVPIVIGRRDWVAKRLEKTGLGLRIDRDFQLIDPFDNPHYSECWQAYHSLRERFGVDPSAARIRINTRPTVLGAMLVRLGYADALLCGTIGSYWDHLRHVKETVGLSPGNTTIGALTMVMTPKGTLFLCDTHVNVDPSAVQLADLTVLAAERVRRFGINPKVALLSHSNFGSSLAHQARKMADTLEILQERVPHLEVEGEMQADSALGESLRQRIFPHSRLSGAANLLVMPNIDAANIALNLLRSVADCTSVGPIIMGVGLPAHVLSKNARARRIVNMTAVAAVEAQLQGRSAEPKPPGASAKDPTAGLVP